MSTPLAYGLDYGTTNSSVAIAYRNGVEVLELNPQSSLPYSLPSISYLHKDGLELAGTDAVEQFAITGAQRTACQHCPLVFRGKVGRKRDIHSPCRQYRSGSGCLDSRLMGGIKTELSNDCFKRTHSWARDFEMEDLAAVVISALKRRADQHVGRKVRRAVIGHPVAFSGASGDRFAELQGLAEDRLREAAHRAGFAEVELYPEPAAAALHEELGDGHSIAVDFGGGTFDVAVIEIRGGEGEVVSLQGAAIGGSVLDRLIFERKVAPRLGLHRSSIPNSFKKRLSSWSDFKHLLTDPLTFLIVSEIERADPRAGALISAIIRDGQAYRFYKAIENAKIALADVEVSSIEFHPPRGDLSIPLYRTELEEMAEPYLRTIEDQIMKALHQAKVEPAEVSTVLRTGGSSHLVPFVEMLNRLFGAEKVQELDAFTTVSYGLGVVAQEEWM